MVWKIGPREKDTLVKILYIIDENCSAGNFARNKLTAQMLANSHIAQTADCDELYAALVPSGVVCLRACMPDQSPRRAIALPRLIPIMLRISVCIYLARGKIHIERTATLKENG